MRAYFLSILKKRKALFIMAIASIFMLTACYQQNGLDEIEYLQAFKYDYYYDEKEEGYTLNVRIPMVSKKEKNPEYLKDLVPFGQEELVLPSYYEGKPILTLNVRTLDYESVLNQDKKIKHIVLPQKLKEIGDYAFSGCSSLTSINIPESVTKIRYYAFSGCSSLTSINIPESVTEIYGDAFYNCNSLTSIIVDSNNPVYDSRDNCNAIIESKSNKLMKGCANTVIPKGVKEIYSDAFFNCSSLASINIPESVTKIGYSAFSNCSSLTSINIPESVTEIYDSAFSNCSSLTSINIPESIKKIGDAVFSNCDSLISINIPESVTEIGYSAFSNCDSLISINIPKSVKTIGDSAFSNCGSLKSVRISGRLEDVGKKIFENCDALETIELSVFVGDLNVRTYFAYPDLNVYIFYSGTIDEFKERFKFYENGEYIIHCSDGDINVNYWVAK